MPKSTFTRLSLTIFAVGALAACGDSAPEADADAPAEDVAATGDVDMAVIEQRQANYEEIGDNFKIIRDQLESGNPDFAAATAAAQTIQTDAAKLHDFFPAGTGIDSGADTEALEAIWEQPEQFQEAIARLETASAELVTAANSGDVSALETASMNLGGACKNCHDSFRLADD